MVVAGAPGQRGVEGAVRLGRRGLRGRAGGEVRALGVPEVFLLVGCQRACWGEPVGDVADFLFRGGGGGGVDFANGAGDDVDVELAGEGLVAREVGGGFGAGRDEVGVVGAPRGEVVLGEDGQVGTLGGGLPDEGGGAGEVVFDGDVLAGCVSEVAVAVV